jgi:hypothetical protein
MPDVTSEALKLDTKKLLDFNSALSFASKHMASLKYIEMTFDQDQVLSRASFLAPSAGDEEKVKLKADKLASFLQSKQGKLEALEWFMDHCCWEQTRRMTDDGRVWKELHGGLKVLRMACPVFGTVQNLCEVLRQHSQNLRVLVLSRLTFGPNPNAEWSRADTTTLAVAIASCKNLVKLSIEDSKFRDEDVKAIISGLPAFRSLSLQGNFAPHLPGGFLTDVTCQLLADMCPDLQTLDLGYQRKVTSGGLALVLVACRRLRELQTSATLDPEDLVHLIQMSTTLLVLGLESRLFSEAMYRQAIESTGGQTVFFQFVQGLIEVPGLTHKCQQRYSRNKQVLIENSKRSHQPDVYNEYEKWP